MVTTTIAVAVAVSLRLDNEDPLENTHELETLHVGIAAGELLLIYIYKVGLITVIFFKTFTLVYILNNLLNILFI